MTGPKIKSEARSPAPARTSRPVPPGEAGTLAAVKQGWENVSTAAQSRRMRVFKYFETAALTQSALPSVDVMASEIGVLSKQMGEYIRRLVTDGLMIKTTHKSFGRYCDHFEIRRGAADRKSTRLNSSHVLRSRMPSSA